jgi:hypothetical protein
LALNREAGLRLTVEDRSRFRQANAVHQLNEVKHVAGCPAAEAVEALATLKDRERGRAILVKRTARLPLVTRAAEFHCGAGDGGDGVSCADSSDIDLLAISG